MTASTCSSSTREVGSCLHESSCWWSFWCSSFAPMPICDLPPRVYKGSSTSPLARHHSRRAHLGIIADPEHHQTGDDRQRNAGHQQQAIVAGHVIDATGENRSNARGGGKKENEKAKYGAECPHAERPRREIHQQRERGPRRYADKAD